MAAAPRGGGIANRAVAVGVQARCRSEEERIPVPSTPEARAELDAGRLWGERRVFPHRAVRAYRRRRSVVRSWSRGLRPPMSGVLGAKQKKSCVPFPFAPQSPASTLPRFGGWHLFPDHFPGFLPGASRCAAAAFVFMP